MAGRGAALRAGVSYSSELTMIPCLDLISTFRKACSKQMPERPHSFMAGLNQKVFLNQWGEPEAQVPLNQVAKLNKLETRFLITDPAEEAHLSVWIYRRKNSILLFAKEKLVSHFSCNQFESLLSDLPISSDIQPIGLE
jgi:hypothetical protein